MTVGRCKEKGLEKLDEWEYILNSLLASTGACLGAKVGLPAADGMSGCACGMFELSCTERTEHTWQDMYDWTTKVGSAQISYALLDTARRSVHRGAFTSRVCILHNVRYHGRHACEITRCEAWPHGTNKWSPSYWPNSKSIHSSADLESTSYSYCWPTA
jgi:hypothetical protein